MRVADAVDAAECRADVVPVWSRELAAAGNKGRVGAVFRFALVDVDSAESLGVVAFAVPRFDPGDVIPQGPGRSLRVVQVLEPEREDQLPVLVVERAG